MTTPADALEVMTVVAACHHRTAPRMDDEQAALATARIWADLFSVHQLELPDLIAAVKKRALAHADAPEPAEIIAHAREIRRDRGERETEAERRAREDLRDAELERRNQLAELTAGLAERKAIEHA
ncbi:hypothetical protein [Mycobacterium asiaticum]|uniref:Uncharacterized protein n=1 Tax=Mycobacterium asiaticum TaxID=1790 RepID=A0A1A3NL38_MYCAS|nr:hypothetical protein [Mycobacterium asiaticum]OBK22541.1 hypothetical protein A5635_21740 [Mycobacterium asiaticum]